jgi:hypothetical protein
VSFSFQFQAPLFVKLSQGQLNICFRLTKKKIVLYELTLNLYSPKNKKDELTIG